MDVLLYVLPVLTFVAGALIGFHAGRKRGLKEPRDIDAILREPH